MTPSPVAGSSRHTVYTGRTTIWWVVIFSCVWVFFLALNSGPARGTLGDLAVPLVIASVGAVVLALTGSSVRATAGPNGVTAHWGLIGWPRSTYPIEQIKRAEVIDLPWWRVSYGFWWTPRRTSCTVRSGPTLQLTLHGGRIVMITVPRPAAAVAALDVAPSSSVSGA